MKVYYYGNKNFNLLKLLIFIILLSIILLLVLRVKLLFIKNNQYNKLNLYYKEINN